VGGQAVAVVAQSASPQGEEQGTHSEQDGTCSEEEGIFAEQEGIFPIQGSIFPKQERANGESLHGTLLMLGMNSKEGGRLGFGGMMRVNA